MTESLSFNSYHSLLEKTCHLRAIGKVTKVVGLVTESLGPLSNLGSVCEIYPQGLSGRKVQSEILGFRDNRVLMMPLEDIRGISPGSLVIAGKQQASIQVGDNLIGRIVDGTGNPIDGKGPVACDSEYPLYSEPMNPLVRNRIKKSLDIGIRAINGLLTIGCGQRVGIFAGSGVGKSVLLGMIAKWTSADVNVIALIGERGREVNEFIEKSLGKEGLKRSVLVVATSDHLPLLRVRAAFVATTIAEYFRDKGLQVNLMMDSLTRFATSQREIGLALGEPPMSKGYTPSVFTMLPKLMERAGTSSNCGAITGLYTVLVEGDDMNEPVADAVRSILDGHIVLTRDLGMQNHYPAIDILKSISRVMSDIVSPEHRELAGNFKSLLATYRKAEDLINIGAYVSGSNPKIDKAVSFIERMTLYLQQGMDDKADFTESLEMLAGMFKETKY